MEKMNSDLQNPGGKTASSYPHLLIASGGKRGCREKGEEARDEREREEERKNDAIRARESRGMAGQRGNSYDDS